MTERNKALIVIAVAVGLGTIGGIGIALMGERNDTKAAINDEPWEGGCRKGGSADAHLTQVSVMLPQFNQAKALEDRLATLRGEEPDRSTSRRIAKALLECRELLLLEHGIKAGD